MKIGLGITIFMGIISVTTQRLLPLIRYKILADNSIVLYENQGLHPQKEEFARTVSDSKIKEDYEELLHQNSRHRDDQESNNKDKQFTIIWPKKGTQPQVYDDRDDSYHILKHDLQQNPDYQHDVNKQLHNNLLSRIKNILNKQRYNYRKNSEFQNKDNRLQINLPPDQPNSTVIRNKDSIISDFIQEIEDIHHHDDYEGVELYNHQVDLILDKIGNHLHGVHESTNRGLESLGLPLLPSSPVLENMFKSYYSRLEKPHPYHVKNNLSTYDTNSLLKTVFRTRRLPSPKEKNDNSQFFVICDICDKERFKASILRKQEHPYKNNPKYQNTDLQQEANLLPDHATMTRSKSIISDLVHEIEDTPFQDGEEEVEYVKKVDHIVDKIGYLLHGLHKSTSSGLESLGLPPLPTSPIFESVAHSYKDVENKTIERIKNPTDETVTEDKPAEKLLRVGDKNSLLKAILRMCRLPPPKKKVDNSNFPIICDICDKERFNAKIGRQGDDTHLRDYLTKAVSNLFRLKSQLQSSSRRNKVDGIDYETQDREGILEQLKELLSPRVDPISVKETPNVHKIKAFVSSEGIEDFINSLAKTEDYKNRKNIEYLSTFKKYLKLKKNTDDSSTEDEDAMQFRSDNKDCKSGFKVRHIDWEDDEPAELCTDNLSECHNTTWDENLNKVIAVYKIRRQNVGLYNLLNDIPRFRDLDAILIDLLPIYWKS